jgi:16S rRNA (cytidine1402-2'-O)-methyltransferase
MIYIVSTPIGNLQDISARAIETLRTVDYILCEDTRVSLKLLNHFEIKKKLISFHKFNEFQKESSILDDLQEGKEIALISDAGTPGISDPGEHLIKSALEKGFSVTSIPGPTALIAALILSGLPSTPFQFVGFLPKKPSDFQRELNKALRYEGTTILYESPHRLLKLLEALNPSKQVVVARELTKKFEEVKRGSAAELLSYFSDNKVKGEVVVLLSAPLPDAAPDPNLSPQEEIEHLIQTKGLKRMEAIRFVAKNRGLSKKDLLL